MEARKATKKMCYAVHCITGKTVYDMDFDEAAKIISDSKKGCNVQPKKASKLSLKEGLKEYINANKEKIGEVIREQFGIKRIVSNDTHYMKEKKSYAFIGAGCGFVYLKYDKRSKIMMSIENAWKELEGGFCDKNLSFMDKLYLSFFNSKEIKYYDNIGCPVLAVCHQNLSIKFAVAAIVSDFAKEKHNVKNVYIRYFDD